MNTILSSLTLSPFKGLRCAYFTAQTRSGLAQGVRTLAMQQTDQALQQAQHSLTVVAATCDATQLLAHFFASKLQPADCYLLYGSVGAGKSFFSRAFIRAAVNDDDLPVPSPTFLLQNIYSTSEGLPIHHFDLYRLTEQSNLARLDLDSSFSHAVSLVEWPERLACWQPSEHLAIHISVMDAAEQEQVMQKQIATAAQMAAGEDDERADSETDSGDSSGDMRWRRIRLAAHGQRWLPRIHVLERYLRGYGRQLGCFLDDSHAAPPIQLMHDA